MTSATRLGDPVTIRGPVGNRIACQVAGPKGAQPVILTSGIGCGPIFYRHIAPALARRYRTVFWDYRAHGRSDLAPDGRSYHIADHADDLEAVVRAFYTAGRPPFMVGFSMGVQVTIEWSRRYEASAAEVPGYVMLLGMPCNPLRSHWLWGRRLTRDALDGILDAGGDRVVPHLHPVSKAVLRNRLSYAVARATGLVTGSFSYPDFYEFICYSSGIRPDAWLRTATGVLEHDALDAWVRLEAPALFISAERDLLVPARECRSVAPLLSAAEYGELEGRSHAGMVEAGPALAERIVAFVDAHARAELTVAPHPESAVAAREARWRDDRPTPFKGSVAA
jgi:pimeloyl-ACP methyl ester carboxylesterase